MQNKKNIEKKEDLKNSITDLNKKPSKTTPLKVSPIQTIKKPASEDKQTEKDDSKKIEELSSILKEKDAKIESLNKAILYEKAELENYRKRALKEKADLHYFLRKDILLQFLPIADNLERAVDHLANSTKQSIEEGIAMTLTLFKEALGRFNVSSFKSIGEKFNPEMQEAMSREESCTIEEGTVTQEFLKGYKMGDLLLRPAQVIVACKPSNDQKEIKNGIDKESEQ